MVLKHNNSGLLMRPLSANVWCVWRTETIIWLLKAATNDNFLLSVNLSIILQTINGFGQ